MRRVGPCRAASLRSDGEPLAQGPLMLKKGIIHRYYPLQVLVFFIVVLSALPLAHAECPSWRYVGPDNKSVQPPEVLSAQIDSMDDEVCSPRLTLYNPNKYEILFDFSVDVYMYVNPDGTGSVGGKMNQFLGRIIPSGETLIIDDMDGGIWTNVPPRFCRVQEDTFNATIRSNQFVRVQPLPNPKAADGSLSPGDFGCCRDAQCIGSWCDVPSAFCHQCRSDADCSEGFCIGGICNDCTDASCRCPERVGCLPAKRCVTPSSKRTGELYDCVIECTSQFGENGRCLDPLTITLWASRTNIREGETTQVTISLDSASSGSLDTNIALDVPSGASLSAVDSADTCTANLCKISRTLDPKGVADVSLQMTCESAGDLELHSKVTYVGQSVGVGNTLEYSKTLTCEPVTPPIVIREPVLPPIVILLVFLGLLFLGLLYLGILAIVGRRRAPQKTAETLRPLHEYQAEADLMRKRMLAEEQAHTQRLKEEHAQQQKLAESKQAAAVDLEKSYVNRQGRQVKLNYSGYEVFPDSGKEFHRWYAEKEVFRKYGEWFEKEYPMHQWGDFEVHHIDNVKTNNDSPNLAVILGEEHIRLSHAFPDGDRAAGIQELRRHGIKQPHISELK